MSKSRRKKRKSAKLFVKTVSTMKVYIICIEKSLLKKIIPTITQFKMGLTLILTKEKLNNGRGLLTRFKIRNSKPPSDNSITLTEKLTPMPRN